MFYCHGGEHRFSEMSYSNLINKKGTDKEYRQTFKLIKYGLSAEQIADVLEKDPRTIETWIAAIAEKSQNFHNFICLLVGITIEFLQMDELWSYLKNKKRQLWLFIALESVTKFWVNFELGSRTLYTAERLVKNLKTLCQWESGHLLKITTDKLAAYKNALLKQMQSINYVYLQIVKKRFKRKLKTVKKTWIKGTEKDFPSGAKNTSYIERFNLTLRQRISYLHRKTLGYCKNKTNLERALWINLFDYNYCQFHKSLRQDLTGEKVKFQKRYQEVTPAMKIGLTTSQLNYKFLMVSPIPKTG